VEKIQQAIERARQQRGQTAARAPASPPAPSSTDLASALASAPVATLKPQHLRDHRVLAGMRDDPRSDVFRKLRTQTMLRLQALDGRSVAVLSARDGEGKTLVACNLAYGIALQNQSPTFLLDMDFRRPSVHGTLGIEPRVSLAEVLEGHADVADALLRVEGTQLYVLPQASRNAHASEIVGSGGARSLVRELLTVTPSAKLVIDCPPVLLTDEPLVVQSYVDGCLLVVEHGRTARDDLQRAAEQLDETKYLGSVLNRADDHEAHTYYGYR
jgi:Mrp family chromosome partitioning ATPase